MGLKIRLRQQGKANSRSFRLVVIESRTKRDGGYVETLGHYDPQHVHEADQLVLKSDRVQYWLEQGAEPSERAVHLIRRAAPEVARAYGERRQVARVKAAAKRRQRRRAQATSSS